MLEQMDLMDMSDHEALDVFLNSGGEDNSVASPMLGIHTYSDISQPSINILTHSLTSKPLLANDESGSLVLRPFFMLKELFSFTNAEMPLN